MKEADDYRLDETILASPYTYHSERRRTQIMMTALTVKFGRITERKRAMDERANGRERVRMRWIERDRVRFRAGGNLPLIITTSFLCIPFGYF